MIKSFQIIHNMVICSWVDIKKLRGLVTFILYTGLPTKVETVKTT